LLKVREFMDLESLYIPFQNRFGRLAEKNIAALRRAYDETALN